MYVLSCCYLFQLYSEQYKNGSWVNVDDSTSSVDTVTRSLSKTKTVTKGYKYRARAVCTAYVGSAKEIVTKYSAEFLEKES